VFGHRRAVEIETIALSREEKAMKRLKLILGITLLLMILPVGLAWASPPINATGHVIDEAIEFVGMEGHGNICTLYMDVQSRMTGTIEATCSEAFQTTVHAPCTALPPPGGGKEKWIWHAQCEGAIDGRTGSFSWDGLGHIDPDHEPSGRGRSVLSGMGGDLSGMHGMLAHLPTPAQGGLYEGFVLFAEP
jgi:hypothetical protein